MRYIELQLHEHIERNLKCCSNKIQIRRLDICFMRKEVINYHMNTKDRYIRNRWLRLKSDFHTLILKKLIRGIVAILVLN